MGSFSAACGSQGATFIMSVLSGPDKAVARRFGQNLARERKRVGISQENLGLLAGLHRTAVGQLERAERVPRLDTVIKLTGSLGLRPEAFLGGLDWKPATITEGELILGGDGSGDEEPNADQRP